MRCVVAGNGPSLNWVDWQHCRIPVIGVNRILRKTPQGLTPTYVQLADEEALLSEINLVRAANAVLVIKEEMGRKWATLVNGIPKVIMRLTHVGVPMKDLDIEWPEPSPAAPYPVCIYASDNTGTYAIQMAAHLGYHDIGVVGMDCYMEAGKPSHHCGDQRQHQPHANTNERFTRGLDWLRQAPRPEGVTVYRLVNDPKSPLYQILPYIPFKEFCNGEDTG